jgi:hypothetical protein
VDLHEPRLGAVILLRGVPERRLPAPGAWVVLDVVGRGAHDLPSRPRRARRNRSYVARDHASLPNHLVECYAGRHRYIEGRDVSEQGEGHQMVAVLADQSAKALALSAEHQGHGPFAVDLVPPFGARRIEADHPQPAGLHRAERLNQVAAARHPDVLEPARGGAGHGLGQPGGVPLGQHDAVRACGLGRPQDRAQVTGILDPVEDHHEGGRAGRVEELVEADEGLLRNHGDEALVRDAAGHPIEGFSRLEAQWHSELAGAADRVGDPTIAQALDHEETVEMTGAGGQRLEHRVDAADEVHGRFVK